MAYLAACLVHFRLFHPGDPHRDASDRGVGRAFTFLLGIEMSRGATGTPAFAALVLLCLSPLFFAQSMLAQLDMPAMCLSILALLLFLQNRFRASAIACMVLVLVKETGVVAPALFGCWLIFERRGKKERAQALWFLLPLPGLLDLADGAASRHGHWFGNAAFTAYNLGNRCIRPVSSRFSAAALLSFHRQRAFYWHRWRCVWALRRMPLLWETALAHRRFVRAGASARRQRVGRRGSGALSSAGASRLYIAFAVSLGALPPRTRQLTFGGWSCA